MEEGEEGPLNGSGGGEAGKASGMSLQKQERSLSESLLTAERRCLRLPSSALGLKKYGNNEGMMALLGLFLMENPRTLMPVRPINI